MTFYISLVDVDDGMAPTFLDHFGCLEYTPISMPQAVLIQQFILAVSK